MHISMQRIDCFCYSRVVFQYVENAMNSAQKCALVRIRECRFDVSVGIGRDNRGAFGHTVNLSFSRTFPQAQKKAKGPLLTTRDQGRSWVITS